MLGKDLAPGLHRCARCKVRTTWRAIRGRGASLMQRCDVCGDRFPCRNKQCGHSDCAALRFASSPEAPWLR